MQFATVGQGSILAAGTDVPIPAPITLSAAIYFYLFVKCTLASVWLVVEQQILMILMIALICFVSAAAFKQGVFASLTLWRAHYSIYAQIGKEAIERMKWCQAEWTQIE